MKKLTQIFAILLPILMGACTSDGFDNTNVSEGNEVSVIEAIMTPFGDVQSESRTAIDMSDSKVNSLVWAEGDTIGIYPSAGGDQLSFPITDGIGTGTCIFTGGGWALKTSTDTETYKYTAYSPFNRKYYLLNDNTALPINMIGQKLADRRSMRRNTPGILVTDRKDDILKATKIFLLFGIDHCKQSAEI
jgi:hypothetical protein